MGGDKLGDFRDLEVWQRCRDIRNEVWKICKSFPKDERYRLVDQMVRSSRSSTACIAEGHGRFHYQENIQFCRQSRGSLYELIDHFDTAKDCGYIVNGVFENSVVEIKTAVKVLNGFIKYLKGRKEVG